MKEMNRAGESRHPQVSLLVKSLSGVIKNRRIDLKKAYASFLKKKYK